MTTQEIAARYGVSGPSIGNFVRRGWIRASLISGGRYMFALADLAELDAAMSAVGYPVADDSVRPVDPSQRPYRPASTSDLLPRRQPQAPATVPEVAMARPRRSAPSTTPTVRTGAPTTGDLELT
jgi:hypothetical protein